ncbi:ABC transporter G family member 4 [Dictyocoela muelleri]|nr:ABC transporter G family member 4 [Dictyocoela muelleri]
MIQWNNLSIKLKNTNKTNKEKYFQALYNTTGHVKKGEMMAILGESGSGKSTFLNTLVGIVENQTITTGQILYEGKERNLKVWKEKCRYVEQISDFKSELNVFDYIYYTAKFSGITGDIPGKINNLLKDLRLTHVKLQKIKKLSGGEKKIASIANAIIANPSILILDEPTSGLDSKNALNVIQVLRKLVTEEQKIIIASLHQPGDHVYNLFDKVMLISRGLVVYCDYLNACLPTLSAHGFPILSENSIHENISEAIDYDERYDEVDIKKQKIWEMATAIEKKGGSEYTKPIRDTPLDIKIRMKMKDIFYLMMRRFQVKGLNPKFYIINIIPIFIFWFLVYCSKYTDGDDLYIQTKISFATIYMIMNIILLILSFDMMMLIIEEKNETKSEIMHFYYEPASYYVSIVIFYFIKMIFYNSLIVFIAYSYLPKPIDLKFYPIMIFLPIIYIFFLPFLISILTFNKIIYFITIFFYLCSYLRNFFLEIIGIKNQLLKSFFKIIYKVDPHVLFLRLMHTLNWSNLIYEKFINICAGHKPDSEYISDVCSCTFLNIFSTIVFSCLFYIIIGIVMISIRFSPSIRLKLGNK